MKLESLYQATLNTECNHFEAKLILVWPSQTSHERQNHRAEGNLQIANVEHVVVQVWIYDCLILPMVGRGGRGGGECELVDDVVSEVVDVTGLVAGVTVWSPHFEDFLWHILLPTHIVEPLTLCPTILLLWMRPPLCFPLFFHKSTFFM